VQIDMRARWPVWGQGRQVHRDRPSRLPHVGGLPAHGGLLPARWVVRRGDRRRLQAWAGLHGGRQVSRLGRRVHAGSGRLQDTPGVQGTRPMLRKGQRVRRGHRRRMRGVASLLGRCRVHGARRQVRSGRRRLRALALVCTVRALQARPGSRRVRQGCRAIRGLDRLCEIRMLRPGSRQHVPPARRSRLQEFGYLRERRPLSGAIGPVRAQLQGDARLRILRALHRWPGDHVRGWKRRRLRIVQRLQRIRDVHGQGREVCCDRRLLRRPQTLPRSPTVLGERRQVHSHPGSLPRSRELPEVRLVRGGRGVVQGHHARALQTVGGVRESPALPIEGRAVRNGTLNTADSTMASRRPESLFAHGYGHEYGVQWMVNCAARR
jgi:hypothetical protein